MCFRIEFKNIEEIHIKDILKMCFKYRKCVGRNFYNKIVSKMYLTKCLLNAFRNAFRKYLQCINKTFTKCVSEYNSKTLKKYI